MKEAAEAMEEASRDTPQAPLPPSRAPLGSPRTSIRQAWFPSSKATQRHTVGVQPRLSAEAVRRGATQLSLARPAASQDRKKTQGQGAAAQGATESCREATGGPTGVGSRCLAVGTCHSPQEDTGESCSVPSAPSTAGPNKGSSEGGTGMSRARSHKRAMLGLPPKCKSTC